MTTTPESERRTDIRGRLDFDLWLYVRLGIETEDFRTWPFEQQEPVRYQYIHDSNWHWIRAASDTLMAAEALNQAPAGGDPNPAEKTKESA